MFKFIFLMKQAWRSLIAGIKLLGQDLSLWKSLAPPPDPEVAGAPAIASAFQAELRERKSLRDGRLGNGFFLKARLSQETEMPPALASGCFCPKEGMPPDSHTDAGSVTLCSDTTSGHLRSLSTSSVAHRAESLAGCVI